jgi:L,D-peptidoglycan transpeptidase YkuD (ErfK/YbiS/YcfS/YnhG family)
VVVLVTVLGVAVLPVVVGAGMGASRGDGCVVGTPSLLARDQLSEVNPVRQQGYAGVHASFCLASVFDAPRAQPGRPVPVPAAGGGVGPGSPSAAAGVGSQSVAGAGSSSTTFTGRFGQSSAATAARAASSTCGNEADPAVRRRVAAASPPRRRRVAAAQGRELAGAQLVRGQAGRRGGPDSGFRSGPLRPPGRPDPSLGRPLTPAAGRRGGVGTLRGMSGRMSVSRVGALLAGVGSLLPLLLAGCAAPDAAPHGSAAARTGASGPARSGQPALAEALTAEALTDTALVRGTPGPRRAAPPPAQPLPPGVPVPPAGSNQLVTVLVPAATSTTGTLRAWQRTPSGGWNSVLGPIKVKVGTDGVGTTREGVNRTPRGTFPLDRAFGRQPNPGTALPYQRVGDSDWWVSDAKSPAYNTMRSCQPGTCTFDESAGENLGRAGASYDYAMVIGYNTAPVRPGAGSAFFVHVDAGAPSAGCVEVPRAQVLGLLRWLAPAQRPRITIGLG